MVKFRRWNSIKKRWEDRDGALATCPDWAKNCKEYVALEVHPDDQGKAFKKESKELPKEPEKRKAAEKPGAEELVPELNAKGYLLNPGHDYATKPWEAVDKVRWPNTWWFYFTFYHSSRYHTDTRWSSDYLNQSSNYVFHHGRYHDSD